MLLVNICFRNTQVLFRFSFNFCFCFFPGGGVSSISSSRMNELEGNFCGGIAERFVVAGPAGPHLGDGRACGDQTLLGEDSGLR